MQGKCLLTLQKGELMHIINKIVLGFVYLGIWLCLVTGGVWYLANRTESQNGIGVETPVVTEALADVKRLHKFHGTDSSFLERGKWYFERNGKKCRLWDPRKRRIQ